MTHFIILTIGFMLIWAATDVNRNDGSKIKAFSKYFWIQVLLILIGVLLITYNQ